MTDESPVRRAPAGIAQLARAHGVHAWVKNRKLYRRSEAFQNNEYVSNGVLEELHEVSGSNPFPGSTHLELSNP